MNLNFPTIKSIVGGAVRLALRCSIIPLTNYIKFQLLDVFLSYTRPDSLSFVNHLPVLTYTHTYIHTYLLTYLLTYCITRDRKAIESIAIRILTYNSRY